MNTHKMNVFNSKSEKAKSIIKLIKDYKDSIIYFQEQLDYCKEYEAMKNAGYYERNIVEYQDKINTLTVKYPEYLV